MEVRGPGRERRSTAHPLSTCRRHRGTTPASRCSTCTCQEPAAHREQWPHTKRSHLAGVRRCALNPFLAVVDVGDALRVLLPEERLELLLVKRRRLVGSVHAHQKRGEQAAAAQRLLSKTRNELTKMPH